MIDYKAIRGAHTTFRLSYHGVSLLTFIDDPKGLGCPPIHIIAKAEMVLPRAWIIEPALSEQWRRTD
jgi:hypothetical protein